MIIKELYLKSFGKFSDTKIELEEGFHIFYGENEFGKSTLHAFIRSMLFGLTKGRGRAAKNDLFTKYEPWNQPSYYAGEMTFQSGSRTFVISRRFDRYGKNAELVCRTDGEILSVEQGDMEMLLDGMSEAVFENTISIGQTKAETSAELGTELRNYAANYYCSGNSEMDVERSLMILKERRKTVENRQKEIRKKKQEKREKVEQQAAYIGEELEQKQEEEKQLEKTIEEVKAEEQQLRQKLEKERNRKIQGKNETNRTQTRTSHKRHADLQEWEQKGSQAEMERAGIWKAAWNQAKIKLFPVLFFAVVLIPSLFLKGILKWSVLAGAVMLEMVFLWNFFKTFWTTLEKVRQAEEVLRRMLVRRELLREEIAEKQVQYENLCEEVSELMEVSEEYTALEEKGKAIQLAEETIQKLSTDVRKAFGTRLNETASEILCEITDGRYERIFIDENTKIYLLEGAQKILAEQVSRGTMEQIYFSLRMATAELMYEEDFPVILDETFAYYDDRRLENTLRWLSENKRQIILFTCQKREMEMLNKLGIPYHMNL